MAESVVPVLRCPYRQSQLRERVQILEEGRQEATLPLTAYQNVVDAEYSAGHNRLP